LTKSGTFGRRSTLWLSKAWIRSCPWYFRAVGENILFEGQMAGAWQVGQTWLKTVTALIPLKGVLKRVQGTWAGAVGEDILFEGQMTGAWQAGQAWLKTVTALIPFKGGLKRVPLRGVRKSVQGIRVRHFAEPA
jgi:hypothetical protein